MRIANCKKCGNEFHYCSSCMTRSPAHDEGFCSDKCWEGSPVYIDNRTLALNFYNMLPYHLKRPYWEVINKIFSNCNYCNEFKKWMDKEEDRPFKKEGKHD